LKGLLKANGLETFEQIGVRVNPINRHFALTRAMAVNYMLVARRPENPPADHWALPFFAWLPLGLLESVPSMVDVFGIPGLRVPASIVVGGLLLAAIGFYEP
jgi:hypothetical protein